MAGKLTDNFMNQLEQWIGTGPKLFNLLYSITKDGCNSTVFHQKCDNQGPTVTVLYNQYDSVYGGYTNVNWNQSSTYTNDATAFLFRLQYNGVIAANKFSCKNGTNAVYNQANFGPTFGGGHDLHSFAGTVLNSGGYYALNGCMTNFGSTYNNQGVSASQINNGTMYVKELEVYQIKDGKRKPVVKKPWRTTSEWNMKLLENLMLEVNEFSPPRAVKVTQSKILIMGPVGAGKSSFFNTIASVFRGHVTGQAPSGSAEHSVTSQYCLYQVRSSSSGHPLKFRLCDTRGLEETQGIDTNDIGYLLDGNVPDGYQFNPSVPISPEIAGFRKNTSLEDRIHCVCLVIDGSTVGVLPDKMIEKIKAIQAKIQARRVPQMVLLTKIDKLCPIVEEDTSKVFNSEAVYEQVNKVSQLLGIPRNHVLPIKNYETEIELADNVNILALLTLRQILRATEDYMFNFLDEAVIESDNAIVVKSRD